MIKPWLYSLLGLAGFLVGAYLLIRFALPVVTPFFFALVLAELLEPVVKQLTFKGRVPRGAATGIVLLVFVAIVGFVVTAAVGRLVSEIAGAASQLPYLYANTMDLGTWIAERFGAFHQSLPSTIQQMLANNLQAMQTWLGAQLGTLAGSLGVISSLPMLVTNLLVGLIATFFLSRDRHEIGEFLIRLFPADWHGRLREVKHMVWTSTIGWAKAQLMLVTLTAIVMTIGLSLIGVRYAVTIGLVSGLFDILPVLGTGAIFLPWVLYAFLFGDKVLAIKLLVLYFIVSAIRQMLESKVVGDQVGLHPLGILFALYLGFQFFGAAGFIVGPLLAILLKSLVKSGLLPMFQMEQPPPLPK